MVWMGKYDGKGRRLWLSAFSSLRVLRGGVGSLLLISHLLLQPRRLQGGNVREQTLTPHLSAAVLLSFLYWGRTRGILHKSSKFTGEAHLRVKLGYWTLTSMDHGVRSCS